jgi:hypothetical protein
MHFARKRQNPIEILVKWNFELFAGRIFASAPISDVKQRRLLP